MEKDDKPTIREQLGEAYGLLPLSYIAENYFHHSRAWLYQRLNGYPVRGKSYTLNAQERRTFNQAVADIARLFAGIKVQ